MTRDRQFAALIRDVADKQRAEEAISAQLAALEDDLLAALDARNRAQRALSDALSAAVRAEVEAHGSVTS
jgi:hypothetical protein